MFVAFQGWFSLFLSLNRKCWGLFFFVSSTAGEATRLHLQSVGCPKRRSSAPWGGLGVPRATGDPRRNLAGIPQPIPGTLRGWAGCLRSSSCAGKAATVRDLGQGSCRSCIFRGRKGSGWDWGRFQLPPHPSHAGIPHGFPISGGSKGVFAASPRAEQSCSIPQLQHLLPPPPHHPQLIGFPWMRLQGGHWSSTELIPPCIIFNSPSFA